MTTTTLTRVASFVFAGATAAFSTRIPAGSDYTGPLVRVRRSSDNAETDIGVVAVADANGNKWLDEDALLNWVGVPRRPLDVVTGAAAAFGLRKLRSAYTGAAIRVRRSSDNVEQDIGFTTAGDLDTVALLAFVGAGSGFQTTWYDQSGNGRNLVQAAASAQSRIVNAGVLETRNRRPAVVSPDNQTLLTGVLNVNGLTALTLNVVGGSPHTGLVQDGQPSYLAWGESGSWGQVFVTTNQTSIGWRFGTGQNGNNRSATAALGSALNIITLQKNGGTETPILNGVALTPFTGALAALANNSSNFNLMGSPSGASVAGLAMCEAIVFTNATSDRAAIERSQAAYYGITYTPALSSVFVTTWYDQSGDGRNAFQIAAPSQPRIVNAGAVDTLNDKPSLRFDGVDDFLILPETIPIAAGVFWSAVVRTMRDEGIRDGGIVSLTSSQQNQHFGGGPGGASQDWYDSLASNSRPQITSTSYPSGNNYVVSLQQTGSNLIGRVNGGQVGNVATPLASNVTSRFIGRMAGMAPDFYAEKMFSEVIIGNASGGVIQTIERNQGAAFNITVV